MPKQNYDNLLPSKYLYMPRIGETLEVDIADIREVHNPKFNIKVDETIILPDGSEAKKKKDLGFYLECDLQGAQKEQVLSVNSYYTLGLFKKYNIQPNTKVKFSHKEKGLWEVEVL